MIEYGLSVSVSVSVYLDGTPRTPHCCDYGPSPKNNAPRKYMTFGDIRDGGDGGGGVSVSISPRALFSDVVAVPPPTATARRLDFDKTELSPVSFASASVSVSASVSASVGECGVCYNALPRRSNHVFTLCGHLFCVSCLLKWCHVNMTCPNCRADLIDSVSDDEDDDDDDTVVNDAVNDAVDVERIQLQTQAALNDRIYSDDSDSDSGEDSGGGEDSEDSDGDGREYYNGMLRWSL